MAQNPLPFNIQEQECSEWCWAAVVSSIAVFVNASQQPRQCEVVDNEAFSPSVPSPGCCSETNRCISKDSQCPCNTTGPIGSALADYGVITGSMDGQVPSLGDFLTITGQIAQSSVVVIQVEDKSNADLSHAMVVYGYSGTDTLKVADPADGSCSQYSYSELLDPPGNGSHSRWRLSRFFTTVPPQS